MVSLTLVPSDFFFQAIFIFLSYTFHENIKHDHFGSFVTKHPSSTLVSFSLLIHSCLIRRVHVSKIVEVLETINPFNLFGLSETCKI